jgi:hypothetical protein
MVCVLTPHIAWEHMMTAYAGKNIAYKAAIQAEKALAALAADLITHAAYPSYAIQQIARPPRGGGSFVVQTQSVVLMTEPRPGVMLWQPWKSD